MIFFDSWGAAWESCAPSAKGARAFGPNGAARELSAAQFERLIGPLNGRTMYAAAFAAGRVTFNGDWPFMVAPR